MERFLRYSKDHDRAIRLILTMPEGNMKQVTAVVLAMDDKSVTLYIQRPPRKIQVTMEDILSADYVKGDEGQG